MDYASGPENRLTLKSDEGSNPSTSSTGDDANVGFSQRFAKPSSPDEGSEGSTLSVSSSGSVAKWHKATVCKTVIAGPIPAGTSKCEGGRVVRHYLAKVDDAGPNPVLRSNAPLA